MSHLNLHGVTKRFGATTAVDELSLTVEDGELVVLLGPSGCGKTTCLRLLAGFERPDDGRVELDGQVLAGEGRFVPAEKRDISVVFQTYALWPHLSVHDNVAYGLRVRKVGRSEIARRVEEILELVQLDGLSERAPHELSGGQQQRVALARALITDPSTLLLDEPLSNLDTQLRQEMRLEIKRLQRLLGVTTVYVTHDQAEALSLADRVIVMHAGRIAQQGTPQEVYRQPRDSYVATALGAANIVPVTLHGRHGDLVDAASPCGMRVRALPPLVGDVPTDAGAIAVRPSDVELIEDAEGRGTVRDRLFYGDSVQLTIDVEGLPGPLEVIAPPDTTAEPGARVRPEVPAGVAAVLAGPGSASPATPEREVGSLS